jgi:hypothetical protein
MYGTLSVAFFWIKKFDLLEATSLGPSRIGFVILPDDGNGIMFRNVVSSLTKTRRWKNSDTRLVTSHFRHKSFRLILWVKCIAINNTYDSAYLSVIRISFILCAWLCMRISTVRLYLCLPAIRVLHCDRLSPTGPSALPTGIYVYYLT